VDRTTEPTVTSLRDDPGCGGSSRQVKGSGDAHPDLQPWDVKADRSVGSHERFSCFIAAPGHRNNYSARSFGSGDGRREGDCLGACHGPQSELVAGHETSFQGHQVQAAWAGHVNDVASDHHPNSSNLVFLGSLVPSGLMSEAGCAI